MDVKKVNNQIEEIKQRYLFRPLVIAGLISVIVVCVLVSIDLPVLVTMLAAFALGALLFLYGHIASAKLLYKANQIYRIYRESLNSEE